MTIKRHNRITLTGKVCLFFFVIILSGQMYGQDKVLPGEDIIFKNDSTRISAKVLEITPDMVKYKNYQQPGGPVRNVAISDVYMIVYSDGTKEIFNKKTSSISDTSRSWDHQVNHDSDVKDSLSKHYPDNGDIFIDSRDGNKYRIIKIGSQTWMAENLNFIIDDSWCNHCETYGRLYKYEAANKSCPAGWHLPSDREWTTLTDYLGGETVAGGKLKSTVNWQKPNYEATNSSGFTALPGGARGISGIFEDVGKTGFWWTSSEGRNGGAWYRFLSYYYGDLYRGGNAEKDKGYSVRCVKD